jgi:FkbM family methyltransferase
MKNLNQLNYDYKSKKIEKHDYIKEMHKKHQALFDYFDYIKDTDINSIVLDNEKIFVELKDTGLKLHLDRFDSRFIPIEILNFQTFDPTEKDLIFKLAGQSEIIFDIGANIGWYSLNFGILRNVSKVFSFEPIPRTFEYLTKHIKFNNIKKIFPSNIALSDHNGEVEFFCTNLETGSSSMRNIQERKDIETVICKTQTLTDFVEENDTHIDMIKCDVEGSELFVFKGGQEVIKRDKPFIFTEMLRKWSAKFNYHPDDIISLLSEIGYRCFAYENEILLEFRSINDETLPTNYFFLHNEKHNEVIKELGF